MSGAEGLAVAGVALTIPGIIDLCIKYGEFLHEKTDLYKKSGEHARRHRLTVQLVTVNLRDILTYFKGEAHRLSEAFEEELRDLTLELHELLQKAIAAFPNADMSRLEKVKFAMYDDRRIGDACERLESWFNRFSVRAEIYKAYVLDLKADQAISEKRKSSDFDSAVVWRTRLSSGHTPVSGPLVRNDTSNIKFERLPKSSLWAPEAQSGNPAVLLEYRAPDGPSQDLVDRTREKVVTIAKKLREVEAIGQGILQCQGFSYEVANNRFALHFDIPPGMQNPQSLRTLLADPRNRDKAVGKQHSMTDRLNVAKTIAYAIGYVHSFNFVHKNIRRKFSLLLFPP